ncbi:MAG: response regulator [Candidatus Peribacteraceae bacterium]
MNTFLIADDTPRKTRLFLSLLKRAEWQGEILTTDTVEGAKELIDRHPIAAAFIDYYIPMTNGPSIIRYLKQKHPAARVALVSSADNSSNAAEALAAGAEIVECTSDDPEKVEQRLLALIREWQQ